LDKSPRDSVRLDRSVQEIRSYEPPAPKVHEKKAAPATTPNEVWVNTRSGKFALSIIVTKQQRESRARAGLGITQHGKIAIGVAEGEQRPAADMQADVQRLRLAIVEAVELWQLHERNPVIFIS
jgi:hypothetical protein